MADKTNGLSEKVTFFTSREQKELIDEKSKEGYASKAHYLRQVIADDLSGSNKANYVITHWTYIAICVMAIYSFVFSAVTVYVIRSGFFC